MEYAIDQQRAGQDGRGRQAETPQRIPARGWKDVLWRTWREISNDRVTLVAAGVTYYVLLSLFPALAAFVSIYGLFTDAATIQQHVDMLAGIVPAGGLEVIREQLTRLSADGSTLGWALAASVAVGLWSGSNGVRAMFQAMNVAYGETEERSFVKLAVISLLFTLGGFLGAVVAISIVLLMPMVLGFLGIQDELGWLVQGAGYVLLAILLFIGIALIYRFGPDRKHAKWRWVTPGGLLSVAVIIIVSLLYSWYAANFANFEKTYGSLGALIGLLVWLWLSSTIVIVGAELNAEAEHQTKRDSTVGGDQPMGQRGALVADTIGKARTEGGDPAAEKSPEWRAGFQAGREASRPAGQGRLTVGALAFALPAALALHSLAKRRDETRPNDGNAS